MKKNIIYTLCILLSGAVFFSSCEDMLDIDSERVQYDFGTLTPNDTVYSVLGILRAVQNVADRHVLLGELRGDLVTTTDNAVLDIQRLANFNRNDDCKYNAIDDYYAIINNCNLFLHRVDTALEHSNKKLMTSEYVAVKSVRAWTYMQLAMNYGSVPYFTEPVLSNSQAEEILARPYKSIEDIASELIEDIAPFEDPVAWPMPSWKGIKTGAGKDVATNKLFMPIRVLLGELYLWKGQYTEAARCFYTQIKENTYRTDDAKIYVTGEKGQNMSDGYSTIFNVDNELTRSICLVPMMYSTAAGKVSELAEIFAPSDVVGGNQVAASPAIAGLSERQMHLYRRKENNSSTSFEDFYNSHPDVIGDLRLQATTFSQSETKTGGVRVEYDDIINKFNLKNHNASQGLSSVNANISSISLYRPTMLYLRLAEAVAGLIREEGYNHGAYEFIMAILRDGPKKSYALHKNYKTETVDKTVLVTDEEGNPVLDEEGNPVYEKVYENVPVIDEVTGEPVVDEEGNPVYEQVVVTEDIPSYDEEIIFDFSYYTDHKGIHSRGSGDSEYNKFYTMSDTCVARYLNTLTIDEAGEYVVPAITEQDRLNYVTDLIIDELALEFAFEGYRFTDLIRFAKATGDVDILAKRVAGREFANTVTYRADEFEINDGVYNKLKNESEWYLPFNGSKITIAEDEEDASEDVSTEDSSESTETAAPSEDESAGEDASAE